MKSTKPFAKGGEITISGVTSQAGVALSTSDTTLTILPKAKGITTRVTAADVRRTVAATSRSQTGERRMIEQLVFLREARDRFTTLVDVPLGDRTEASRRSREVADAPGVDLHQPRAGRIDGRQVRAP